MESRAEKKNRLSRLLGTKRDKSQEPPSVLPDSAYASSETPSGEVPKDTTLSTPDYIPAEKNSEIANIDQGRNLAVRPSTGEVLDRDTGEVVTVVTTTTTTTTTTTRKPGGIPEVNKDVQRQVQEITPTPTPTADVPAITGPSEMPANPAITSGKVPDRGSSRPPRDSPPIPTRSAARKSAEYGNRQSQVSTYPGYDENLPAPTGGYYGSGGMEAPPSPLNSNFSYPQRNRNSMEPGGPALSTMDSPQRHNKSTISDLRAAAKGIHGVGETLRGTINSAVDQNFPRKNEQKAAAANAKNEEALARGRAEMERVNIPAYQRTKNTEQAIPGSWSEEEVPPTTNAATTEIEKEHREKQKARSIGKLFKRKPVAGDEGGLRVTNP